MFVSNHAADVDPLLNASSVYAVLSAISDGGGASSWFQRS